MRKISILLVLISLFVLSACAPIGPTTDTYIITFDTNGGSLIDPLTKEPGVTLNLVEPTKEGFIFEGWFTDVNLTMNFTSLTMTSENFTLYAKWSVHSTTYKINYYLENTVGVYVLDSSSTLSGQIGESVSINIKTYTGYELNNGHPESKLVGVLGSEETLILSAYYSREAYTVTFKDFDDQIISTDLVYYNENALAPVSPTRVGYTFDKWDKDLNNVASDLEVKALYKANSYIIGFNVNGANASIADLNVDFKAVISVLPTPIKTGFTFDGWYLGSQKINLPYVFNSTSDVTFMAKWSENNTTYTINYYLETAEGAYVLDSSSTLSGYIGESVSINIKAYTGYELFDEHQESKLMGVLDNEETLALSAYYNREIYTVTFKDFDDQFISAELVYYNDHVLAPVSPTRVGYTFDKWDKDLNNITSDLEIKALYNANNYIISFDANGGIESFSDQNIDFKAVISELPTPTKTGFRFDGWYLASEIIELPYVFSSTHDVVLLAKWTESPEGITYEIINEEVRILSYDGTDIHYTLPDTIAGYPVAIIGQGAFANNTTLETLDLGIYLRAIERKGLAIQSLKTIVVPDNVTIIVKGAFHGTSSLTSISLPFTGQGRNENWDTARFGHIFGDESYPESYKVSGHYIPNGLTEVTITDSTAIKNQAFFLVKNIVSITLNEGITSIGEYAFSQVTALAYVLLPESLVSIGYAAFSQTTSLTSLVIPSNVTGIGDSAFYLSGVHTITFKEGSSMTKIGYRSFRDARYLTSIIIPESVTIIEYGAFDNALSLNSVVLPEGITSIGNSAFANTNSLTNINIPNSVAEIGQNAFDGASSLVSFVIPEGVTIIKSGTFSNATSLESVTIPSSVTVIEYRAFYKASSLTNVTIPSGVTSIGDDAFGFAESITDIVIPAGVTEIGDRTFYKAISLVSITLPNTITKIGDLAFANTTSLTHINLPNGLEFIGRSAFYEASSLTNLYIPSSVLYIGQQVFKGCDNLVITAGATEKPNGWHSEYNPDFKLVIWAD